MKSPLTQLRRPLLRLLAGGGALLLYVGALTPVGPLLTAFVGGFDSNHQIQFTSGSDGVSVVLHHGEACCKNGHHHGLIARALVTFAQPASETDPDHILQFHAAAVADKPKQLALSATRGGYSLDATVPVLTDISRIRFVNLHTPLPLRPPPGDNGQLLCLRSTVLVI